VGAQKKENIHLNEGTDPERFALMRHDRDAALGMPRLIIPSVQVNMRAGELPKDTATGDTYLQTPVNSVFSKKK
jgi:hypothetical protein